MMYIPFRVKDKVRVVTDKHAWIPRGTIMYIDRVDYGEYIDEEDGEVRYFLDIRVVPSLDPENTTGYLMLPEDLEVIED